MSDILVIPIFAGGLFFLPVFLIFSRDPNPLLRKRLLKIFVATAVVLGALTVAAHLPGLHISKGSLFFPVANFLSIAFSTVTCLRFNESIEQRLSKPPIAALAAMTFVFTVIMFNGGFQNLDIALHEARTTATITGRGSHGVPLYEYKVNGNLYEGAGNPGTNLEILYSAAHPYFSSTDSPFILFGQMLVGMAFVAIGAYSIRSSILRKEKNALLKK